MTSLRGLLLLIGCAAVSLLIGCSAEASSDHATDRATISIFHSHFSEKVVRVPAGVPVSIMLQNNDPIEHEWIVGTEEVHEAHRKGTEAYHDSRPTEVTLPAFTTHLTTVVFDTPGDYAFICHLPGHEAYGMRGILRVAKR